MHEVFSGAKTWVIASHNDGKIREIGELLAPFGLTVIGAKEAGLADPEETETSFEGNALLKARAAATASGHVALADDSGLAVDALDGAPGIYSARWAGEPRDFALAARLSGPLSSAFPDGPPASDIALDPGAHLTQSARAADIVIMADADFLDPAFFLSRNAVEGDQVAADNLALVMNIADALAGDPALVSLRSRASSIRPMERVERLRTAAEARYRTLQQSLTADLEAALIKQRLADRRSRSSIAASSHRDDSWWSAQRQQDYYWQRLQNEQAGGD